MDQGGADRRRRLGSVRLRPWRTLGVALLLGFVALNVLAYRHAGAMLTYHPGAPRPPSPESLTWSQKVQVLLSGVALPRPTNQRTPDDVGLKAATVAFQAADGTRLEAWLLRHAEPRGTVLVFHGYSASRASLLDEAAEFFRLGYHVLLLDFRGCGGSDGTTTTLGCREAEDVVAAVEYVRQNGLPRPLVLYGQSMGAAAVLRSIAVHNVRADAVILESPFARMLGAVRNRFDVMGVPSTPAAELLVFWGGVRVGFPGFEHNPLDYAHRCTAPTLVLHGDADRLATPAEGRAICDAATGPKEFVTFAGAGHESLYVADAEQWRNSVATFLTKHASQPAVINGAAR